MQVDAILLRRVHVWDRKTPQGRAAKGWGALHAQRLRGARLADLASQAAYQAALEAERRASEPCDGLVERAREAASSSALAPAVDAVQWLKGVGFVCALAFCAEVGDFSRFASGRRVTPCFGLAPSKRPGGDVRRCGGLTKGGCRTVRRLLVECAWHHCGRANPLCAKRGPSGVAGEVARHAAKGSRRPTGRRASMLGRGVCADKADAATAAKTARWMWALGATAQAA